MAHFSTTDATTIDAYRIGGGPRPGKHWAHRWHVDFWFRSWQAEWEGTLWCPRSWTKALVLRKARRWRRRGTDIKIHERRYGRNDIARWERETRDVPVSVLGAPPDSQETPTL